MRFSGVSQGIEDQGERTNGGNDREQDSTGAERLAAGDIEGGSGECGDVSGEGLRHDWVVTVFSRQEPGRRRSGAIGHTDSVDGLPRGRCPNLKQSVPKRTLRTSEEYYRSFDM